MLFACGLPGDDYRADLGSEAYARQRCIEVAERAATLLKRLAEVPALAAPHLPAAQVAALLLRHCGNSKVTHLLRGNPPATVAEAARFFGAALLQAYVTLAGLGPPVGC